MLHDKLKLYQENPHSWAVKCSCGWKEKGITRNTVEARFEAHKREPHK